jgi:hypothetical protein
VETTWQTAFTVRAIGRVESPLVDRAPAPMQGDEGAPDSCLVFDADTRSATSGSETR